MSYEITAVIGTVYEPELVMKVMATIELGVVMVNGEPINQFDMFHYIAEQWYDYEGEAEEEFTLQHVEIPMLNREEIKQNKYGEPLIALPAEDVREYFSLLAWADEESDVKPDEKQALLIEAIDQCQNMIWHDEPLYVVLFGH